LTRESFSSFFFLLDSTPGLLLESTPINLNGLVSPVPLSSSSKHPVIERLNRFTPYLSSPHSLSRVPRKPPPLSSSVFYPTLTPSPPQTTIGCRYLGILVCPCYHVRQVTYHSGESHCRCSYDRQPRGKLSFSSPLLPSPSPSPSSVLVNPETQTDIPPPPSALVRRRPSQRPGRMYPPNGRPAR
jgi:hypothetical protein